MCLAAVVFPCCGVSCLPACLQVPVTFRSAEEYVGVFEPLVTEEAREGVRATYQESLDTGRGWAVGVSK